MTYLTRYNPRMNELEKEIGAWFGPWLTPYVRNSEHMDLTPGFPKWNVQEEEDHYLLTCEIPGVSSKDLKLEVKDQTLTIAGEKKSYLKKKEKDYSAQIQTSGQFQRSFTLPADVDAERIEAQCEDGVLHAYLPKSEEKKARQIKVSHAGESGIFSKLLNKD